MTLKTFNPEGKAAVVTGAGRGIGKGVALILAGASATVSLVARTGQHWEPTAAEVRRPGRRVLVIATDRPSI
jgi:7-alpha-hydroxysteroid dehydrogenase